MLYETTYILLRVELHHREYCDIQIAIDYDMKLKIYYISTRWWPVQARVHLTANE